MKKVFCSLLVILLLGACAPSQEEIQATVQASIAETQKAMPTNTPAPTITIAPTLSITEITLDPEILRVEDLGKNGGEIVNGTFEKYYLLLANGENQLSRELVNKNGKYAGFVTVVIHETPEKCEKEFTRLRNAMKEYNVRVIKENVFSYSASSFDGVVYFQENLLIVVDTNNSTDSMVFYAESLAERIFETLKP